MAAQRRSILEKYDIPVQHLDYDYVRNCKNAKELEKILKILKSGEEGFYPDLIKCTEDILRSLKPNSKVLWTEDTLIGKYSMDSSEWKAVNESMKEWSQDMKVKDKHLLASSREIEKELHPIREIPNEGQQLKTNEKNPTSKIASSKGVQRIKSTDYGTWDKYDADTEELKIDLEEEKHKAEVERKNHINLKKSKLHKPEVNQDEIMQLTDIEKENLATRYKDCGNESFKIREYSEAIWEYTQCIKIHPSAVGYNNRAIAYLKSGKLNECIEDCDHCLQIEPKNVKALLRKAQACSELDKKHEAYKIYLNVVEIDPANSLAQNKIVDLKRQLPDLPPATATRIKIQEDEVVSKSLEHTTDKKTKEILCKKKEILPEKKKSSTTGSVKRPKEDVNLVELVMPNKIVKSKLKTAVEKLSTVGKQQTSRNQSQKKNKSEPEMNIFPKIEKDFKNPLIQEIS